MDSTTSHVTAMAVQSSLFEHQRIYYVRTQYCAVQYFCTAHLIATLQSTWHSTNCTQFSFVQMRPLSLKITFKWPFLTR